ncbi:MATE family efflux transporter [Mycoplasmatota bacterium]|nr:MATE family efflux transporter [Mycoplasmatota bacterium]
MKKFIGDKIFYKRVLAVALPITLQQFVTAAIQIVDNFMVGKLGESALVSVAAPNQLYFVMILFMFGLTGGAGIYSAQYFGSKDFDKLRQSFRFKLLISLVISILAFAIISIFGESLIRLFIDEENTVRLSMSYLRIVKFNILPIFLSICISSTFREVAKPKLPMIASLTAIFTNTILNYILIFGKFGAPQLGVVGAAYATLIARYLEFILLVILVKLKGKVFSVSIFSLLKIEFLVFKSIVIVALPMMLNEILWSLGQTAYFKAYSTRGENSLAAFTISNSVSQLVFIVFAGLSGAIAVMVGNTLGANKLEEAKSNSDKLIAFSMFFSFIIGMILVGTSYFIPDLYEIQSQTKEIVGFNLRVNGFFIPIFAANVGIFFALRAGGDTKSTLIMDALFMWVVSVPLALLLAYFTKIDVRYLYLLIQSTDLLKLALARYKYKQGNWIKNLAV